MSSARLATQPQVHEALGSVCIKVLCGPITWCDCDVRDPHVHSRGGVLVIGLVMVLCVRVVVIDCALVVAAISGPLSCAP